MTKRGDVFWMNELRACFKQGTLGLWRRAIDFVSKEDLREERARDETEIVAFAVKNRQSDHIGREHVAGELNARKLKSEQARQGVCQRGLADAGQVFDQQVAARQQAGQRKSDLRFLAEDDAVGCGDQYCNGGGFSGGFHCCGVRVVGLIMGRS